jgi:hypothetical protein
MHHLHRRLNIRPLASEDAIEIGVLAVRLQTS